MIDFAKSYKFCKNDLVNYLPFPIFSPFFTRGEVIDEFLKKPHRFPFPKVGKTIICLQVERFLIYFASEATSSSLKSKVWKYKF